MTRIYNGKITLNSAFNDASSCNLHFGMWFQPDIPNPGVDLSKLRGNDTDVYPYDIKNKLKDGVFATDWRNKIDSNFDNEELKKDRLFNNTQFQDQYEVKHYPMKFLSQITSPDLLTLDHYDPNSEHKEDKQILSMSEIAHFVRCIPFRGTEDTYEVWSSPEFFLTLKKGSVVDHAILMACLFQGTIFEDHRDLENYRKILEEKDKKKRRSKIAKFRTEANKNPLKDRVFICLGTLNGENDYRKHAWVMTINRSFNTVTFWETCKPVSYKLKGRINHREADWLK